VVGTARLATNNRDALGKPVRQANVINPEDPRAEQLVASLAADARALPGPGIPELPAVVLHRALLPAPDGTLSDPAALDGAFLDGLRHASPADVALFKQRGI